MKCRATFDSSFLAYAVQEYLEGHASLSELATKTGLDVPAIMDAVAAERSQNQAAQAAFLAAARSLSEAHEDPAFYDLAVKALAAESVRE